MTRSSRGKSASARKHLVVSILVGLLAAVAVGTWSSWKLAPLVGWDAAIVTYMAWVWLTVATMSAGDTKTHAIRENPGRAAADVILIVASIASLVAVGFLILQASSATGGQKALDIGLGLLSVVLAWGVVHTTYMLKYARMYYGDPEGGIDFNESDPPRYSDFAYMAFTLGMTFQVSDTDIKTKAIRATALKHSLLSYLFGTVIIATTINTLASLSQ